MHKKKIIRITTVPASLGFMKGQLRMLSQYYEIVVVSSPGEALDRFAKNEGVRAIGLPMQRRISIFKDIVSLYRLIILFAKERPDAVHTMCGKAELLGMFAAWITRVPIRIDTFTGLMFPTQKGIMRMLLKISDGLICYFANYLNPEGYGVKKDLLKSHLTKKELHVIGNGNVRGLDLTYYNKTPEVLELASKLKCMDKVTFCFVGRIVGDKGINELLYAFNKLYKIEKNICLWLIGSFESDIDPLLPESLDLIYHHPGIELIGPVEDVRPFYAAADIFVFPSYREGMPNSLLEAAAMDLPSIVTDINGSNEIILDGRNGEIIPSRNKEALYEKMKDWIENSEKVKRMSLCARDTVAKKYDQRFVWQSLLSVYKELLP